MITSKPVALFGTWVRTLGEISPLFAWRDNWNTLTFRGSPCDLIEQQNFNKPDSFTGLLINTKLRRRWAVAGVGVLTWRGFVGGPDEVVISEEWRLMPNV